MATRYDKTSTISDTITSGYEGEASKEMSIPPCGIEDVDRAFYDLFNEKLPLFYKKSKEAGEQTRIPVIFATGERFAFESKRQPLRDRNGALILPIISITRSGVEQDSSKQGGVSDKFNEMVIRKRISPEDPVYQNLVNSKNLLHSEFASAGKGSSPDFNLSSGRLLDPKLGKNIFEIFVIPMPKYFTLKYEITVWCQYNQQANDVITAVLGSYVQPGNRTIRIDTKKGYWFVAYFEPTVSQDNNFTDSTDSERIIKIGLTAEVPGYLILPEFPGSPNGVRSFVSAPSISFASVAEDSIEEHAQNIGSGYSDAYTLSDIETDDIPVMGDQIGISSRFIAESKAGVLRDGVKTSADSSSISMSGPGSKNSSITIGKTSKLRSRTKTIIMDVNPYTGKQEKIRVNVISSVPSWGEEVFTIDVLETIK